MKRKLLSAVFLTALTLSGCGTKIPPTTPCLIDGDATVAYCAPPDSNEVETKTISQIDKYVCLSPRDLEAVMNYIRRLESRKK
jgi:hypothetical protein